jgi:uncharacterized protein YndB with AHSA1/START domain
MSNTEEMTMDDATVPEPGVVRFERLLPAPIDRVWAYLADTDLRSTWLGGGTIEPRVGGIVDIDYDHARVTADPQPNTSGFAPHHELGTVLEYEAPRLLAYSWGEWFGQYCVVRFELSMDGDATRLVLTHSRIASLELVADVATGWHGHLDALEDKLAGGSGVGFWDNFDRHHGRYTNAWL